MGLGGEGFGKVGGVRGLVQCVVPLARGLVKWVVSGVWYSVWCHWRGV
jgi:hypothetical protein